MLLYVCLKRDQQQLWEEICRAQLWEIEGEFSMAQTREKGIKLKMAARLTQENGIGVTGELSAAFALFSVLFF